MVGSREARLEYNGADEDLELGAEGSLEPS
jgi:hypothetical protein